MNDTMKRIIEVIEDIEEDDGALSLLDYDIYEARQKGLDESIPGIQSVFRSLQNKRNAKINNLKFDDGIEIEWDGTSVFVTENGHSYIKRVKPGQWETWV